MNNIFLIVVAHPDDEVLGCFATASLLIQNGWYGYTLILSSGKTSRGIINSNEIDILNNEMLNANKSIGIKNVYKLNFPDNEFDSIPLLHIVKEIERIKNIVSPKIIFTHHYGDMNIDHQITHQAVLTATRPMNNECVKSIYSMEIPSSTEWNAFNRNNIFIPNVFIDVSSSIEYKINAMKYYASELREYPHPRSLKFIRDLSNINGIKVGLKYSENFMLDRRISTNNEISF